MRRHIDLPAPSIGGSGTVIAHGHYGRPVIAFPAESGRAWDWEGTGMVAALAPLLEAGRLKLYCVDSYDAASWSRSDLPIEQRAREHERWEAWVMGEVVPFVLEECGGVAEIALTGCSLGAFHAANLCLKHADRFPLAICLSGSYDPAAWHGWGERGETAYFNNPLDYVAHLDGGHLDWLRSRVSLLLVCGQGQWEDTTGSLESTRRFAELLNGKGIRCELDLWGHDVPHDWPSWQRQLAHHMPRFC